MRKLFGFILVIILTGFLFSAKITVTSPTSGLFQTGSTLHIHWTTSGITGNVKILLVNKNNPAKSYTLKTQQPFNIPLSYSIVSYVVPGEYSVRVEQGSVFGHSGFFTIKKGLTIVGQQEVSLKRQAQKAVPRIQGAIILRTVTPDHATPNILVTIDGSNFGSRSGREIRLIKSGYNKRCNVKSWTESKITVYVPWPDTYGVHKLALTDSRGMIISNQKNFIVEKFEPRLTSVSPRTGGVHKDQILTVEGYNFGDVYQGQWIQISGVYNNYNYKTFLADLKWSDRLITGKMRFPVIQDGDKVRHFLPSGKHKVTMIDKNFKEITNSVIIRIYGIN